MPLFTNPVTINDGTADHSYSFNIQMPAKAKQVIGKWIEAAAGTAVARAIFVKHNSAMPNVLKSLVSFTEKAETGTATGVFESITVNITVASNTGHTEAQVQKVLNLALAGAAKANFLRNLRVGEI